MINLLKFDIIECRLKYNGDMFDFIQFVNNNEKKEENNRYGYVRDLESGS